VHHGIFRPHLLLLCLPPPAPFRAQGLPMSSDETGAFAPRRIVVADEDLAVVSMVVQALRADGHAVFHAYDALSPPNWLKLLMCATSSSATREWRGPSGSIS
jgi:hypothetical protein